MVEITDGQYRAYITNNNIFVQHIQYEKILNIEKETLNITEISSEIIRNLKSSMALKPHAIIGIMEMENVNFLIFVKSAYFIGKIEEAEIYRIKDTEIVPILTFEKIEELSSDVKSQILGIKNLLTLGFFYSFNYDLTNSTQKLSKLKGIDILSSANKKFFWNYCLYKKFYTKNNSLSEHRSSTKLSDSNSKSSSYINDNNKIGNNNFFFQAKSSFDSENFVNKKEDDYSSIHRNDNKSKTTHKTKSTLDLYIVPAEIDFRNANDPIESHYFNNLKPNDPGFNDEKISKNIKNNAFYPFTHNNFNKSQNGNLVNYEHNNINISENNFTMNNNFNKNSNNEPFNFKNNLNHNSSNFIPKINKIWMVVCIYGHVGIVINKIHTDDLYLYLISRRSVYHSGTRYLTRGLDDQGHVANFVETEQILKYENNLLSFIQYRGSVPIFFEQPGMTAQTQITRTPELTAPAFKKHIEEIKEDFNFIYMVNLMNVNKPNEHIITRNFENQIKINNIRNSKYLFWDFQNQCKYDNYEHLDTFVNNLDSVFKIFKFYQENTLTGEKIKDQIGIIRTNCLDCLDRTNVIQARIAWRVIENQLNHLNIKGISEIFACSFISAKTIKTHPLMESFKDIWSENGDSISFQYAGTPSCITSVTKNGKHGFFGLFQHGLVSITRFYQGNFEDSFKQKCIDTLLQKNLKYNKNQHNEIFFCHNSHLKSAFANTNDGNNNDNNNIQSHPSGQSVFQNKINEFLVQSNVNINAINSRKNSLKNLNVFIGSWNVGGKDFPETFSLIQWLLPKENILLPDIYAIGLQEICNLNAKNIMLSSSNSSRVELWKNIITNNLNQLGKYALVKSLDLVGIFIIILIKENLCEYLTNIDTSIVRTGLLGTLGNKGSCIIRFNIENISLAFCCSHLKAGSSQVNSRTSEMSEILNKNFSIKNYKDMKLRDHDVQFIFGDLNFRVDIDLNNCLEFIKSGYIETLFLYDQLFSKKSLNLELMELDELPVKFPPTYKYQINCNDYDLKDKRVPSWCDRILFNKSSKIKGLEYNHVEMFKESDHKPIYGIYNIRINENTENNIMDINKNFQQVNNQNNMINSNPIQYKNNNYSNQMSMNPYVGHQPNSYNFGFNNMNYNQQNYNNNNYLANNMQYSTNDDFFDRLIKTKGNSNHFNNLLNNLNSPLSNDNNPQNNQGNFNMQNVNINNQIPNNPTYDYYNNFNNIFNK